MTAKVWIVIVDKQKVLSHFHWPGTPCFLSDLALPGEPGLPARPRPPGAGWPSRPPRPPGPSRSQPRCGLWWARHGTSAPFEVCQSTSKQLYHVALSKKSASSFKKHRMTLLKRIAWPSQAKIWGGGSLWEGRTCQPKLCSQQPGRSAGSLKSLNSDTMKNRMIS